MQSTTGIGNSWTIKLSDRLQCESIFRLVREPSALGDAMLPGRWNVARMGTVLSAHRIRFAQRYRTLGSPDIPAICFGQALSRPWPICGRSRGSPRIKLGRAIIGFDGAMNRLYFVLGMILFRRMSSSMSLRECLLMVGRGMELPLIQPFDAAEPIR